MHRAWFHVSDAMPCDGFGRPFAPLIINVASAQPTTFMTMTKETSTSQEVVASDILKTDVL
jgi:hypothetical protein